MTLVERLREHGSLTEMEAADEIERLQAAVEALAAKANEVAASVAELSKANEELGLVLNPNLSLADIRKELKRRAVNLDDEMKRQWFG